MYAPPLTPTSEFARAASAGFFLPFSDWNFAKLLVVLGSVDV